MTYNTYNLTTSLMLDYIEVMNLHYKFHFHLFLETSGNFSHGPRLTSPEEILTYVIRNYFYFLLVSWS